LSSPHRLLLAVVTTAARNRPETTLVNTASLSQTLRQTPYSGLQHSLCSTTHPQTPPLNTGHRTPRHTAGIGQHTRRTSPLTKEEMFRVKTRLTFGLLNVSKLLTRGLSGRPIRRSAGLLGNLEWKAGDDGPRTRSSFSKQVENTNSKHEIKDIKSKSA
jgi:hypothetical protein